MYRRLAGLLLLSTALLVPGATSSAQSTHQALVVIDTGSTVRHVCIRFTSASISGRDALDLAARVDPSVEPVYRDYGGDYGVAVCSLCGVGTSSGDCPGSSGNYWAYYRAVAGSTQFAYSSSGASSTTVHDGDVEGWHWRPGTPPYASVQQVCGTISSTGSFSPDGPGQPAPAPAPARAAASPGGQATTPLPSSAGVRQAASQASVPGSTGMTTVPSAPQTSSVPDTSVVAVSPAERTGSASRPTVHRRPSGGSAVGLAGFAAAMALLVGVGWQVRRRRSR
ncbi:MAG: hypothetical protein JWP02_2415 [Acidimicrobiales bacterium]|nr:hypothetical protein [Acidimicrobiales bacterium]